MGYKIGLTIRFRPDYYTMCVNRTYYTLLKEGNFEVVVIMPNSKEHYEWLASELDGLLIAGGLDLDASYYHQENHPTNHLEDPIIDEMDFGLMDAFLQAHKPIFGICRGIQVINAYYGGTLIQDIPSQYETTINHSQKDLEGVRHKVEVQPNTVLSHYFEDMMVNSFHHQVIDQLADGLVVNAISEDGLIEGVENDEVIAVQWHPERLKEHQKKFTEMMKERLKR